ncbi:MAG TPA: ATP-grasp domain-containing protein [Pseudomonadota bacterium]|jgi:carbamoyl-phosphate synthase large subunit|nr:ATP-grasp domain-containing protein [Pseudomonadota bacterium]
MSEKTLTVAVTGLNATDNPAPGVAVIRALRDARPSIRIVGLAYDALDPGIYATDLLHEVFLLPYPSQGLAAFWSRLAYVHEKVGLDVILPTLDAELPAFLDVEPRLQELGIRTLLPTREQFTLREKGRLPKLGEKAGILVPATAVVNTIEELGRVHHRVPYPFFVKGLYYGAQAAHTFDEASHAFYKQVAQWGIPVIVQTQILGEEFNVVALGDGEGGLTGAVAMKKLMLTDKGKGWAGITVRDPALLEVARKFMSATHWRGPCEIELMRDKQGQYHLIEINPRFPAWVYLSAGAGMNLPDAAVDLAMGKKPNVAAEYQVGTLFVRISIDQIARLEDFQNITTLGEVSR